jgi:catechol 2,3-dioxygenase-like lactoylglutathione lyase family enzyme
MNKLAMLGVSGAAILAISSAQAQTAPKPKEEGLPTVQAITFYAAAVPSADIDRSIAFYTKGLGMTAGTKFEPNGSLTEAPLMFPNGGPTLMLQHPKSEGGVLPTRGMLNRIILVVPDLKALDRQLTAAGYHLDGPIREQSQYHVAIATVTDPDGNHIEMVQRTP